MYRINPGDARTDLYGIGKGAAQVVDLSPLREAAAQERKQNFLKQQADQKAADDRVGDVSTQLAGLNKIAVLPREQPMFAKMQADLYEDVKKNIGKIRSGDTNALLDINQRISDVYTKAELSKNTREQLEKYSTAMVNKGFDKYSQKSRDYFFDYVENPKYNGEYNFDPNQIYENFDYGEHLLKDLAPYASRYAKDNQKGLRSEFTIDQAKQLIKDDVTSDPIKMRQANDDFEAAQDKLGAKDPIEFYQNKYANKLLINSTDTPAEWMVNGSDDKDAIKVTQTINDNGGEVHVMDDKTNESVTLQYDADGNVIGGVQGTRLTPAEKTENDKVIATNLAREKAYNLALDKAKKQMKMLPAKDTRDPEYQTMIAMINFPDPNDPAYKKEPIPYKEKNIKLDKKQALEIAHDKFKIKTEDIISGKGQKNVDVQPVDNRTKKDQTAAKSTAPKEGDKKTFKEGPATFKGGKWVLDKK